MVLRVVDAWTIAWTPILIRRDRLKPTLVYVSIGANAQDLEGIFTNVEMMQMELALPHETTAV